MAELLTVSIGTLMESAAEPEFLVKPWLPLHGAAVLGADPGLGKTWLTLRLALDVAAGQPWLGHFPVSQGTVLIVDEENAIPLLKRRLDKLAVGDGKDYRDLPIHFAVAQGLNLSDFRSAAALAATIRTLEPKLVILDSLIRMHRARENAAEEMAAVLDKLKQLLNKYELAILFNHHNRKPGQFNTDAGNSLRGSGDIRAFVDSQLALRKTEQGLIMSQEKARWTEPMQPFSVRVADTPNGGVEVVHGGAAPRPDGNPTDEFILDALAGGPVTRKVLVELALEAGTPARTVDYRLKVLVSMKRVRKLPRQNGETPYELVEREHA